MILFDRRARSSTSTLRRSVGPAPPGHTTAPVPRRSPVGKDAMARQARRHLATSLGTSAPGVYFGCSIRRRSGGPRRRGPVGRSAARRARCARRRRGTARGSAPLAPGGTARTHRSACRPWPSPWRRWRTGP